MSRRTAVSGMVTGSALLAGCGSDPSADDASTPEPSASPSSEAASASPAPSEPATEPKGATLARADAIAVGSGEVVTAERVVVTRPDRGTYRAFDATCTHEGCLVTGVEAGEITCPCHGSRFSAADGSVTNGPAEQPLAPVEITVADGQVRRTP